MENQTIVNVNDKEPKKENGNGTGKYWVLGVLLALGAIGFYYYDLMEVNVETPAGSFSVKKGDASVYVDTLNIIKNMHLKEIEQMQNLLENINEEVKNPKYLNSIKKELRELINQRTFHVDESNRLLEELDGFRFKKPAIQRQILAEIFQFLSGDDNPEIYEDYAMIASEIIGEEKIRTRDSTITDQKLTIEEQRKTIRQLKSKVLEWENKFAALEYELEQYKSKVSQLQNVAAEKQRIEQLYNDLLIKANALENQPPVVIRDTVTIKGDTTINHITEQRINQYPEKLRYLQKENSDLLKENKAYQEEQEMFESTIKRKVAIDAPFFYPLKAGLRRKTHTYKVKHIEKLVFEFEASSLIEGEEEGEVLIEIRFGVPVKNREILWKKKNIKVVLDRKKTVYLDEIELGRNENNKPNKFTAGVYYLRVFHPEFSLDKEIYKMEFAAD